MGCIRRTILTPNRLFLPLLTASVEGFDTVFTEYFTPVHNVIFLADGDRKAYFESSQWTMKKNKETIAKLREKNKQLRADLAKKKAVSSHSFNLIIELIYILFLLLLWLLLFVSAF